MHQNWAYISRHFFAHGKGNEWKTDLFPIVILGWVLKGEIMAIHRETNALLTKIVLSSKIGWGRQNAICLQKYEVSQKEVWPKFSIFKFAPSNHFFSLYAIPLKNIIFQLSDPFFGLFWVKLKLGSQDYIVKSPISDFWVFRLTFLLNIGYK